MPWGHRLKMVLARQAENDGGIAIGDRYNMLAVTIVWLWVQTHTVGKDDTDLNLKVRTVSLSVMVRL